MSYQDRLNLYKKLSTERNRPLICYVTSIRPGCSAQMEQDVLPLFIKQINSISDESTSIDLLVLSNGGDPIVSWRIISLLREKFNNISVLIPYTAYSAATLLALGADEIIMHPFGNLGPIDPQLTFNSGGVPKTLSYEDITKYIEFVKDTGITDQNLLEKAFEKLTAEIPPTLIGVAKRGSQLGLTMGEKLLATHMKDSSKTTLISETLNTKFYHHGYPLSRTEAKDIGLPISDSNPSIEQIIWDIYEDFANEFLFNEIFDPIKLIQNNIVSSSLSINNPSVLTSEFKSVCLESESLNCYTMNVFTTTYVINNDMSLTHNTMLHRGNWIIEKGEQKNDV